jgi:hypothetical protein
VILELNSGLIIIVPAVCLSFPDAFDLDSASLHFDLLRSV